MQVSNIFITAVCFIFLIKLRRPMTKSLYKNNTLYVTKQVNAWLYMLIHSYTWQYMTIHANHDTRGINGPGGGVLPYKG